MHKILVVGPSWIGDTVLAQPLFKRLHERHADLALDVLTPEWTRPVVERMAEVRRAILNPFAHGELKLGARRRLGQRLRNEGYEAAIVLPNAFKSALVPWFARIPVRTGFRGEMRDLLLTDVRRRDARGSQTLAQCYASLAGPPGTSPHELPRPSLHVDPAWSEAVLRKLGLEAANGIAALCPGAEFGPAKRWPPHHFAELGKSLFARGLVPLLIGSSPDRSIAEEIARLSDGACRNLCGDTTLAEAIDLIACARLAVSNDSGLMHIAAAVGTPLVALYGSSSPAYTPPLSDRARVVKLDLDCSPCFRRECPLGHFNCMMQLTPEVVLAAIDFDKIRP